MECEEDLKPTCVRYLLRKESKSWSTAAATEANENQDFQAIVFASNEDEAELIYETLDSKFKDSLTYIFL